MSGTKCTEVQKESPLYSKNKKMCVYCMYTSTYCIHTTPYTPYIGGIFFGQLYTLYLQFILQKLKKFFTFFILFFGGEKK